MSRAPADAGEARGPRFTPLLVLLGVVVVLLSVVFGGSILRNRAAFDRYKAATLVDVTPVWQHEVLEVHACVDHTVQWAMQCPGLESWCANEAPQLTRLCLEQGDRSEYCDSVRELAASTRFGYHECDALREDVEGKYAKRSHKKFCAAAYRAVAEHCRAGGR